ncbi:hypothetical protein [Candidatus Endomicrobiellum devescovinae]|jgi:hypothetical protein|uniref:hypothetical protein n=1 Tax=Candidatus Endomicrobiellum devescovinae TaxID=3242322 RepID=UPI002833F981|nr:hypothetical protein [Endomicrobium sp.]
MDRGVEEGLLGGGSMLGGVLLGKLLKKLLEKKEDEEDTENQSNKPNKKEPKEVDAEIEEGDDENGDRKPKGLSLEVLSIGGVPKNKKIFGNDDENEEDGEYANAFAKVLQKLKSKNSGSKLRL